MNYVIDSSNYDKVFTQVFSHIVANDNAKKSITTKLSDEEIKQLMHEKMPEIELKKILEDLNNIAKASDILSRKVELRLNKDINRIIITIMDKDTNDVIREIPCRELQDLALHLKEAIGILFDKKA